MYAETGDVRSTSLKELMRGRALCDKEKNHYYSTGWQSFEGIKKLVIHVECDNDNHGGVGGEAEAEVWLYIRDTTAPKLSNYGFTTNGTVNPDNENELFIKLGTENEADPDLRYQAASQTRIP